MRRLAPLGSGYRPDVAVIIVGGHDVTHRVRTSVSVRQLAEVVGPLFLAQPDEMFAIDEFHPSGPAGSPPR
ncbi:MAG: hypothetical protein AVDCRST_MAG06-2885 [uncultured Nocardioides sp.]|uniref:Uncharacterized protein n=1 Tax=uncultured Nocardioides sp. TaxID=198441 RepID=A0A6J4PCG9_9ACTN|nr:MAG: hypothetical protein AVDCRST_MAG06-2885 [uncultured Nocardioides sp.]